VNASPSSNGNAAATMKPTQHNAYFIYNAKTEHCYSILINIPDANKENRNGAKLLSEKRKLNKQKTIPITTNHKPMHKHHHSQIEFSASQQHWLFNALLKRNGAIRRRQRVLQWLATHNRLFSCFDISLVFYKKLTKHNNSILSLLEFQDPRY
jgi:hypothetical protein